MVASTGQISVSINSGLAFTSVSSFGALACVTMSSTGQYQAAGVTSGVLSLVSMQVAYIDEAKASLLPDAVSPFECCDRRGR